MYYPLVTAMNGAFGKPGAIEDLALEPIDGSLNNNYRLTMTYKVRRYHRVVLWIMRLATHGTMVFQTSPVYATNNQSINH